MSLPPVLEEGVEEGCGNGKSSHGHPWWEPVIEHGGDTELDANDELGIADGDEETVDVACPL